jgi:hypothetical protein
MLGTTKYRTDNMEHVWGNSRARIKSKFGVFDVCNFGGIVNKLVKNNEGWIVGRWLGGQVSFWKKQHFYLLNVASQWNIKMFPVTRTIQDK